MTRRMTTKVQKIISSLIALAMGLNAFGFHSAFHLSSDSTLHICEVSCDSHEECQSDHAEHGDHAEHPQAAEHQYHSHNDGTEHEHKDGDKPHRHDCSLCHQPHGFAEQSRIYQIYPPVDPNYIPAWDKCSPKKPILEQDVPPIIA
jgi:hypothetical protein